MSTRTGSEPALTRTRYLIVGAGVHGLSTAYHLARQLSKRREGSGEDILVLDKSEAGAGASGIACGVVRNNYYQPAMSELMRECVQIWEAHSRQLSYHGSGYIALGPPSQESDLSEVYARHQRLGYRSQLILGEREVASHMRELFPDWRAPGLSVCLHERQGGFAHAREAVKGLEAMAAREGVRFLYGVEALEPLSNGQGETVGVQTERGVIRAEQTVLALGPWIGEMWARAGLPAQLRILQPDGQLTPEQKMWTYWYLQEGEIRMDPSLFATQSGALPPVLHVDSEQPLHDQEGRLLREGAWGIYFKRDREGVQGGAEPLPLAGQPGLDPYPSSSVDPDFPEMWSAALSHCMSRFQDARAAYHQVRSGGAGAFTVDNFPVFDWMRPGLYVAADSNHGFKMLAVGREIAGELRGERSRLLHPFRYARFAEGELHPVSNSPYPWS